MQLSTTRLLPPFCQMLVTPDVGAQALEEVMVTTRLSWTPCRHRPMDLALLGNNITDEQYIASGTATYSGFGINAVTRGKAAHFGLDVRYEWR